MRRPRCISDAGQKMIEEMIQTAHSETKHVTYFQILDALQYQCPMTILNNISKRIVGQMENVRIVIDVPTPAERAALNPAEMDHWCQQVI
jgi:hypothetical protein